MLLKRILAFIRSFSKTDDPVEFEIFGPWVRGAYEYITPSEDVFLVNVAAQLEAAYQHFQIARGDIGHQHLIINIYQHPSTCNPRLHPIFPIKIELNDKIWVRGVSYTV